MTAIDVRVTNDTATPLLNNLLKELGTDRAQLHKDIAGHAEVMLRDYLMGLNRHKAATRLGATPTDYFERKAQGLESRATKEAAIITIPTGDNYSGEPGLEAFARVFGPVKIAAQAAQWLTIPATAAAYGRRAREFGDGLFFVPLKTKGTAMLARRDGKKILSVYWLKKSVTLSQDSTLLPTDEAFAAAAERGAEEYAIRVIETK